MKDMGDMEDMEDMEDMGGSGELRPHTCRGDRPLMMDRYGLTNAMGRRPGIARVGQRLDRHPLHLLVLNLEQQPPSFQA